MTKYNFNRKISRSQIGWEEYKDKQIQEERERIREVAEHLGIDPDLEDVAKKIGWGKTLEEKIGELDSLWKGWIMKKTNDGEEYRTVVKIKEHNQGEKYQYGRIQVTVDPAWIGYPAEIIVSKTNKPRLVTYAEEIKLGELNHIDTKYLAEIVHEKDSNDSKLGSRLLDSGIVESAKVAALEEQIKSIYMFFHTKLDPILDFLNDMIETPEGKIARDKVLEARMAKAEAERET